MKILQVFAMILISYPIIYARQIRKTFLINRADTISPPDSPFISHGAIMTMHNHQTIISSHFELTRDIKSIKVVVNVIRCANREQLDSCMPFTTMRINDACTLLNDRATMMSPYVNAYKPPLRCPLYQGHYKLVNGTLNPNLMQLLPLDNWYWKADTFMYEKDTNELLAQLCFEGQIVSQYL